VSEVYTLSKLARKKKNDAKESFIKKKEEESYPSIEEVNSTQEENWNLRL